MGENPRTAEWYGECAKARPSGERFTGGYHNAKTDREMLEAIDFWAEVSDIGGNMADDLLFLAWHLMGRVETLEAARADK